VSPCQPYQNFGGVDCDVVMIAPGRRRVMTGHGYAVLDMAIGRWGIVLSNAGALGVQLPKHTPRSTQGAAWLRLIYAPGRRQDLA
jgi:hypothetical protein